MRAEDGLSRLSRRREDLRCRDGHAVIGEHHRQMRKTRNMLDILADARAQSGTCLAGTSERLHPASSRSQRAVLVPLRCPKALPGRGRWPRHRSTRRQCPRRPEDAFQDEWRQAWPVPENRCAQSIPRPESRDCSHHPASSLPNGPDTSKRIDRRRAVTLHLVADKPQRSTRLSRR